MSDQQNDLAQLFRSLDRMGGAPEVRALTDIDGFGLGLEGSARSNPFVRGFAAQQLPIGLLELGQKYKPGGRGLLGDATLRNRFQVGEGLLGADVSKGLNNPAKRLDLSYSGQVGPGQLSARASVGQDERAQRVKEAQLQYLMQLGQFGLGLYGSKGNNGTNFGLNLNGSW